MIPGEIDCNPCTGELFIDGVSMHGPAFCVVDVIKLWLPTDYRGDNPVIGGVVGTFAEPLLRDQATYVLKMDISGVFDFAGQQVLGDYFVGLETNVAYLDPILSPPDPPSATKPAELHMPSGAVRTADVQPFLKVSDNVGPITRAELRLIVTQGRFS